MPSKKQYNLVNDDAYDSRIPLHSEEAFQHGIAFHAKYIGTLDVPRPSSRVEIVAAMRRIRFEFKAKAIKKKKVTITISVEGVKISFRKKKKKNQWSWDDSRLMIMHHPVYRIFYVSHDSQDLKIFSYIARDGGSNVFKCNVFKSSKKSQAMRIVRTIGQAFEVCHKLSLAHATSVTGSQEEVVGEKIHEATSENTHKDKLQKELEAKNCNSFDERTNNQDQALCCQPKLESLAPPTSERQQSATETSETYSSPRSELLPVMGSVPPEGTPLSIYHQMQLMREQLEQQTQHTQTALAHVQLLKDQLAAESTARLEAQAQNHQLLVHNKELLEHIRVLVQHIHDLETKVHRLEGKGELPFSDLPSLRSSHQTNDSTSGAVHLPDFLQMEQATSTSSSSKFSSSPVPHLLQNAIPYGSPSGSPRPCNTSHETSVFSGLSLPSSPTQQQSNLDELMLLRRSGSPHVIRNRSPVYSQTDGLTMTIANNGNNNNSLLLGFHPGEMNSAPPRLNPPPQKFKAARPDAEPSITMPSCNGKPSWSESDRHEGALSWSSPPSLDPLSTAQMNLLLRQYGVPSSQHLPTNNNNNTETFFSQAIRDLTKLNLLDRGNAPAVKTSPVVDQTSPSPTSFMRLFKS